VNKIEDTISEELHRMALQTVLIEFTQLRLALIILAEISL
jgi:hypothetical protein